MNQPPIPNEPEMAKNLINQVFSIWVNPELEKRKKEGRLPDNFNLIAAQVIFTLAGNNIVRINEDVRVKLKVKRTNDKPFINGEPVTESMIQDIEEFILIDEEKDFGHLTLIKIRNYWHIGFDFRYNLEKPKELLKIGAEFLSEAKNALDNKKNRPLVECLYIAAENILKAKVFLYPDQSVRKTKTHQGLQSIVNKHARISQIISEDHRTIFNRLTELRDKARYDTAFSLDDAEAEAMFNKINSLCIELEQLFKLHTY